MSIEVPLPAVMFVLCRKDINMSPVKLAQQVAIAVARCGDKGIYSKPTSVRAEWYATWVFQIYVLGCDNLDDLHATHRKIIERNQEIPTYIVKDPGYCQQEPETITCLGIGACDRDIIKDIVMQFQMY